jgi:hypothetical protein
LIYRIRGSWAFRPAELAIIFMMMLVSLSIPGRGLLEQFTSICAMPVHWNRMNPGWQDKGVLDYVPPRMLVAGAPTAPDDAITGYIKGVDDGDSAIDLGEIPWAAWKGPLSTYLPMLLLLNAATLCLVLIVHRQWSVHERLRYPIAEVGTMLINRDDNQAMPPIFCNKLFWLGLGGVCLIRWANGIDQWTSGEFINIPMMLDMSVIAQKYPIVAQAPWGWDLTQVRLFPIVIGFSFFLASDISFSLGISQYLIFIVSAIAVTHGINMSSSYMAGGPMGWHRAGAYVAFALVVFYTGRRYYLGVLKRTVGVGRKENVPGYAVWASRVMWVCIAALIVLIIRLGVGWPMALLAVGLMMVSFVGVARITAETGLFFVQPRWQAMGVMLGLFGAFAMGAKGIIVIGLLCCVLTIDQSQALMAYFTNALKICTNVGIRPARAGGLAMGTWVIALLIGLTVVLWANYNYGTSRYDWSFKRVPSMPFRPAIAKINGLQLSGGLRASDGLTPWERIGEIKPDSLFPWSAGTGFALVLVLGAMRLRLPHWPLHPVLPLVWATYPMVMLHHSFLIGWILKEAIVRVGGKRTYDNAKPLMVGLIAGELLAAMVLMAAGAIHYSRTGEVPPVVPVMPR